MIVALSTATVISQPALPQPRLPGPAAAGWFVMIGQNPNGKDNTVCMAFVVAADAADERHWVGVDDRFEAQTKVGPYKTVDEATDALKQTGWRYYDSRELWFASSGCNIDPAKIPQPPEPSPPPPSAATLEEGFAAMWSKIRPCWNSFGGSKDAPIVTFVVEMKRDGTPAKAEVKESGRYSSDPVYRAAADSAWRAIMNPRCQPWPLPPDRYESWRILTLSFDPRDY